MSHTFNTSLIRAAKDDASADEANCHEPCSFQSNEEDKTSSSCDDSNRFTDDHKKGTCNRKRYFSIISAIALAIAAAYAIFVTNTHSRDDVIAVASSEERREIISFNQTHKVPHDVSYIQKENQPFQFMDRNLWVQSSAPINEYILIHSTLNIYPADWVLTSFTKEVASRIVVRPYKPENVHLQTWLFTPSGEIRLASDDNDEIPYCIKATFRKLSLDFCDGLSDCWK